MSSELVRQLDTSNSAPHNAPHAKRELSEVRDARPIFVSAIEFELSLYACLLPRQLYDPVFFVLKQGAAMGML
jgi:hypothetical protein